MKQRLTAKEEEVMDILWNELSGTWCQGTTATHIPAWSRSS